MLQIEQRVYVDGKLVNVGQCEVRESSAERVPRIEFIIDRDVEPEVFETIDINSTVRVEHEYAGEVVANDGTVEEVEAERLRGDAAYKRVVALGIQEKLSWRRYVEEYEGVAAAGIVEDALEQTGADALFDEIDVRRHGATVTDTEYTSRYDSAFEVIDEMAERFRVAWKVRDGTFLFYDPAQLPATTTIEKADFDPRSITYREDGGTIRNYLRAEAWSYETFTKDVELDENECTSTFQIDIPGDYEVLGDELSFEVRSGEDPFSDERDITYRDGEVRFRPDLAGGPGGTEYRIKVPARKKVIVRAKDDASIAEVGQREGTLIPEDGGWGITEALEHLDGKLRQTTKPEIELRAQVYAWPLRIEEPVLVDHPDLGIDSEVLYVEELIRSTRGPVTTVEVTLTRAFSPRARRQPDAFRNVGKRIQHLERRIGGDPAAQRDGDFDIAKTEDAWAWSGEVEVEPDVVIANLSIGFTGSVVVPTAFNVEASGSFGLDFDVVEQFGFRPEVDHSVGFDGFTRTYALIGDTLLAYARADYQLGFDGEAEAIGQFTINPGFSVGFEGEALATDKFAEVDDAWAWVEELDVEKVFNPRIEVGFVAEVGAYPAYTAEAAGEFGFELDAIAFDALPGAVLITEPTPGDSYTERLDLDVEITEPDEAYVDVGWRIQDEADETVYSGEVGEATQSFTIDAQDPTDWLARVSVYAPRDGFVYTDRETFAMRIAEPADAWAEFEWRVLDDQEETVRDGGAGSGRFDVTGAPAVWRAGSFTSPMKSMVYTDREVVDAVLSEPAGAWDSIEWRVVDDAEEKQRGGETDSTRFTLDPTAALWRAGSFTSPMKSMVYTEKLDVDAVLADPAGPWDAIEWRIVDENGTPVRGGEVDSTRFTIEAEPADWPDDE